MKKLLILAGLVALNCSAINFSVQPFISPPFVGIQITNGQTLTYADANVPVYTPVLQFNAIQGTNVTYVTNKNINPVVWLANGGGTTNANGSTNGVFIQSLSAQTNANGGITGGFLNDVRNYADGDGNAGVSQAVSISLTGDALNATNNVVFTFVRSGTVGRYYDLTNSWPVTLKAAGTVTQTLVTNVPSWFAQGADRFRLQSTVAGTNTGAPVIYLNELDLCGFNP